MKLLGLVFLFLAAVSAVPAKTGVKSYEGYKVFRALPSEEYQLAELLKLQDVQSYDFWSEISKHQPVDIMATPESISELEAFFKSHNIGYTTFMEDVEKKIQDSAVKSNVKSEIGSPRYSLNWDDYYRLDVIYEFFYSLAADFPNLIEVQTIGTSYEGRDIIMAKVSSGGGGTKPAMFVDGTFHAREWISPATLTFAVRELVENYAAHPELVDNIDWFFVPVVNPDGYEYTFTNDRLWRKTRAPTQGTCTGTDPNRNWDFHWSEPGASDNTCSQTYHGDSPFSEVETAALRDVMLANLGQLKMYVSLHSYSQLFLLPWGYTTDLPDNYADQLSAANRAIAALTAVSGTQYEAGTSSNILYINSGSSKDWAHGVGLIPYSYVVELPDTGSSGFLLPPSEIIPTGTEMWEAFKVLAEIVAGLA
ncbi:hypothetical protein QYM36_000657 [Artemia franciscana]|uniref:Peptidase M14 domain-containing protein n=1 Tax=Artemia franciscana TaxID=6661 RepID=A0AA88IM18_ARTSF|nr:hypothetical protein QYM36_000657 [Artemia franciscana]